MPAAIHGELLPMLDRIERRTGSLPEMVLSTAGITQG
jgi:hypothetical protein